MLAIVCNSINSLQNKFTCVKTELLVDFSVCHELSRVKDYLHVETAKVEGRRSSVSDR